jgi:hypothetical protein
VLHDVIALFLGLFLVIQLWLAILESRLGSFTSHAFRGAALVVSLVVPLGWLVLERLRARPRPRLPASWSVALLAVAIATSLALFFSIQPFRPDADDTFRAGFVRAILGTGFPPSQSWWTAAASGRVPYYVLIENIVAQLGALWPGLSTVAFYEHHLKAVYIVCNVLLGFSIARDLGALDRMVVAGRPVVTAFQTLVGLCAFLMLIFGATPFELAADHLLGVSQSGIAHSILLLFIALVVRPAATSRAKHFASSLIVWSLPAVLAMTKFPFVPALVAALGLHWLLERSFRQGAFRAVVLPLYLAVSVVLAMASTGLTGTVERHPLAWLPLRLFHELAPHWFTFASWPLFWRVAVPFGLFAAPMLLLMLGLSWRHMSALGDKREATLHALILTAAVMLAGEFASATIGFADREGANEIYWFVQGWSALNVLVFIAVMVTPPSWVKLAVIPFALYSVHSNWVSLRQNFSTINAPLSGAALDACRFVATLATASDDRRNTVVAHPFDEWDFASCTSLPTLAPPDHRYNRFARGDKQLVPSQLYMQALVSASALPAPPSALQPTLARYAHILIIRSVNRPFADTRALLVHRGNGLLIYDVSPALLR